MDSFPSKTKRLPRISWGFGSDRVEVGPSDGPREGFEGVSGHEKERSRSQNQARHDGMWLDSND